MVVGILVIAAVVVGGVAVARRFDPVALAFYVLGVGGFAILGAASLLERWPFSRR